jgi:hypothetical protein
MIHYPMKASLNFDDVAHAKVRIVSVGQAGALFRKMEFPQTPGFF